MFCLALFLFAVGNIVQVQCGFWSDAPSPLPFPACRAWELNCLRRGVRNFFFLMDERQLGMAPVDPSHVASVALAYPDIGLRVLLRHANVTGARWTELVDRRIDNKTHRNTVVFSNDFHVSSTLIVHLPVRREQYLTNLVMDIRAVHSNVSYPWWLWRDGDGEMYVSIGQEETTVLRPQRITFFLEGNTDEPILRNALENRPSILEHLANEIATIVMQNVINNFRVFANSVPLRFYYKLLTL